MSAHACICAVVHKATEEEEEENVLSAARLCFRRSGEEREKGEESQLDHDVR
jgi:hypothetical protein